MTLYELTAELQELQQMLEDGEIDEQTFADTVEAGLQDDLENKIEGYGMVIANINATVDGIKAEQKRLADRKAALENRVEKLTEAVQKAMTVTNNRKIETTRFTFSIAKCPAKLVIDNEEGIPFDFMVPQPAKPDNAAIKEALKRGEVFDFAHLENGEKLRIK